MATETNGPKFIAIEGSITARDREEEILMAETVTDAKEKAEEMASRSDKIIHVYKLIATVKRENVWEKVKS